MMVLLAVIEVSSMVHCWQVLAVVPKTIIASCEPSASRAGRVPLSQPSCAFSCWCCEDGKNQVPPSIAPKPVSRSSRQVANQLFCSSTRENRTSRKTKYEDFMYFCWLILAEKNDKKRFSRLSVISCIVSEPA
jgi:hypothetical protein